MVLQGRRLAAAALALTLAWPVAAGAQTANSAPQSQDAAQVPQSNEGDVNWQGAGYGAAAVFGNLLYIPAKVLYAFAGGLVGGGSYLVTGGNTQVSNTIWRSSLGGDYVLTPSMIEGKEPVHFSGPNQIAPLPPESSSGQAYSGAGSSAMASSSGSTSGTAISSSNIGSSSPGTASSGGGSAGSTASEPIDSGSGPVHPSNRAASSPLPNTSVE